jgi:Rrf2 family protein
LFTPPEQSKAILRLELFLEVHSLYTSSMSIPTEETLLTRWQYWSTRSISMLFSRSTEYAIRAMTFLASREPGKRAGAREISEAEKIPMPFLWKILHILTRRRLVRSFKGMHGGYELAAAADKVPLGAIVSATDGAEFRDSCVLGLPECDNQNPCPLHEQWKDVRTGVTTMLDETSLADLARVTKARRRNRGK